MHFVQQTRAQKANHVLPSEIIMVVKELVVMVIDEDQTGRTEDEKWSYLGANEDVCV